jgi:two-component system, LuxR family, response regulator FixJ
MSSDKKQIYIVDDDESVGRALKLLMMTYGFAVEIFSSAEKFFSAVSISTPGCLILDIHLPGMNGWEAKRRLTESGCSRRVIMITADKEEGLKERALKAGALGYLQKPFNDQELLDLSNLAF